MRDGKLCGLFWYTFQLISFMSIIHFHNFFEEIRSLDVWQRSKYTSGNGRPQANLACGLPFPEVYLERCQTKRLGGGNIYSTINTYISRTLSYHRNFSKMFIFPVSEVFSDMNSPFEDIFDHEPY